MPVKVAILGGGMGALAAAWRLSQSNDYDITVYQRDRLLGGKGASTRAADPNFGARIQEHGIHLLMGFYERTFALLRECYAELDPAGDQVLPFEDAFTPWDSVTMGDEFGGEWGFWKIEFPSNPYLPGVGAPGPTILFMFANAAAWFVRFLQMLSQALPGNREIENLRNEAPQFLKAVHAMVASDAQVPAQRAEVGYFLEKTVRTVWPIVRPRIQPSSKVVLFLHTSPVRRLWISLWFAGTVLKGMIDDQIVVPPHDFGVIDDRDFRTWLQQTSAVAAPAELSWNSPPVQALYDLAFSNEHELAAGTVLYNGLHIALAYRGHVAYKMNAGMGEVVFAPLYLALEKRGVQFRFLHDVTALHVGTDGATGQQVIERIDLRRSQPAVPANALAAATVTLASNGLDVPIATWREPVDPIEPWVTDHLDRGTDFDVAVLGISVGALRSMCTELREAHPPFAAMIEHAKALSTQAVQLWFTKSLAEMGWPEGPAATISFARPFNSWVDMSHVRPSEGWTEPKTILYFADEQPFADLAVILPPSDVVRMRLEAFIAEHLPALLPNFTPADLHDPNGGAGLDRLASQYWRANDDASDRYVITPPGSPAFRLAPGNSGFRNLALAGDWVRTSLNTGCLEGATEGGLAAAAAIVTGLVAP